MGRGATTDNLEGEVEQLKQLKYSKLVNHLIIFNHFITVIVIKNNINPYNDLKDLSTVFHSVFLNTTSKVQSVKIKVCM